MISRRLLRIKALMALYAYNRREDNDLAKAEKELVFSIEKSYDLYHYILLLILELADIASEKIDFALQKKMPSYEDLNPNRRFADNRVIDLIRNNPQFRQYLSKKGISWANQQETPRKLFKVLVAWPPFIEYMNSAESSYSSDRKIIMRMVTEFFPLSEDLVTTLEELSIFWNDDLEYISAMIEKTIKKIKGSGETGFALMPLYSNEDDEKYVVRLLRSAIFKAEECRSLIDRNTTNWEVERIALMDILVMQLAITEILEFSEIPVKVTLNEYIEIAKYYCTSKSSTFVNGILDKVVVEMRKEKMFSKAGRGLVGEVAENDPIKDE